MQALPRSLSVLLLDDDGHHSQKVAVCLGQIKGLKLHVVSNRRWVPIRFSRHVASFQSHRPGATEAEQLETILRAIRRTRSEVLLPVVDSGSRFLATHQAELCRHIALAPVPPLSSLDVVLDKNLFCRFLAERGLPQPPAIILQSAEPAAEELGQLTFPVLFKPARGGGGGGIKSFADPAALLAFLRANWRAECPALVQSYIPGHDVDCSVLCRDGKILAHTLQTSLLPRRNQFGSDEAIEFIGDPQTLALTAQLVAAFNWSGVAHLDFRRDQRDQRDQRVKVIDFNPRYWTSLLGSLAAGVNFPYLTCLAALGIAFPPPTSVLRHYFTAEAAVRRLAGNCIGRSGSNIALKESGLGYALSDPGPRVYTLAQRTLPIARGAPGGEIQTCQSGRGN